MNQPALDAFIARKAAIDELLAKFQAASAAHFNCSPDEVNWIHVSNLGYALKRLADAATILQS